MKVPTLFGFPIWRGKVKRRIVKKYLRRFHRQHTLSDEYRKRFDGYGTGSYVNDCSGLNGKITEMTPCYYSVGRRGGEILVDVDFMTTNTGCSLASCGVEPALDREVIEKRILEHHQRWTLGEGGEFWYGKGTEQYQKATDHARKIIDVILSGGHVVTEQGEPLDEFRKPE